MARQVKRQNVIAIAKRSDLWLPIIAVDAPAMYKNECCVAAVVNVSIGQWRRYILISPGAGYNQRQGDQEEEFFHALNIGKRVAA
jgi:hypothetical protein